MNRIFTRLGFTAAAIVAGSGIVGYAQDATTGAVVGTIKNAQGQPVPGARVTLDGGRGAQVFTADETGQVKATGLIPGRYFMSIAAPGYDAVTRQSLIVQLGMRTPITVSLVKSAGAVVEVMATVNKIDSTQATTGAQFTNETFSALPLGRSFTSIAQLAPGVVSSGVDASNPSIGGGSGLENQYVIDGANTTNPGYGSSGSYSGTYGSLGTGINGDFIAEVQVKSFALDAEFGQTTGGIVNAITKSGSNTFEGSVFAYLDFDSLQAKNKTADLIGVDQPTFNSTSRTELGFFVSGPIIKDKLFYFVGYNPISRTTKRTSPLVNTATGGTYPLSGREFKQETVNNSYYAKVQWQISSTQLLELSTFGDPGERKNGPQTANDFRGTEAKFSKLEFGSNTVTAKYTASFFSDLLFEARASSVSNTFKRNITAIGNSEWNVADLAAGGASISPNAAGLFEKKLEGKNDQFDFKLTKTFGDFELKVGYLTEKVSFDSTSGRSGPVGFVDPHSGVVFTTGLSIQKRYYVTSDTADPATAQPYYRIVRGLTSSPTRNTETDYSAYFIQGNYKLGNLNLKAGLRWEEQELVGTDITYKFKASDNLSPRLSATWDIEGNGKSKLYAFYGRYYEKVPLDIAVRALSTEKGVNRSDFYTLTGFTGLSNPIMDNTAIYDVDPLTQTVNPTPVTSHYRTTGSQPTQILPGTKSMYQDEYVLGFDMETGSGMTLSNRLIYRDIGRVLEDLSLDGDSYFIGNPGENENSIRALTGFTGTATFPKPERKYWAYEVEARKTTAKWTGFLNLRISKVEGNYEGLFRGDNGQDDPNISSLFDLPVEALEDPARGLTGREQFLIGSLPSDRTIVANLGYSYTFDLGLNLGFVGRIQTGTPITSYLAHPVYENAGEVPVYGRGTEGRTPTSYTFDTSVSYTWKIPGTKRQSLTFRGDVFNLFNSQKVTSYDTNVDLGLGASNPNYMKPITWDTARQVRLGVKYSF